MDKNTKIGFSIDTFTRYLYMHACNRISNQTEVQREGGTNTVKPHRNTGINTAQNNITKAQNRTEILVYKHRTE